MLAWCGRQAKYCVLAGALTVLAAFVGFCLVVIARLNNGDATTLLDIEIGKWLVALLGMAILGSVCCGAFVCCWCCCRSAPSDATATATARRFASPDGEASISPTVLAQAMVMLQQQQQQQQQSARAPSQDATSVGMRLLRPSRHHASYTTTDRY